jgi:hypothetical protein
MEGFWSVIAGEAHQKRNSIRTPSSEYVTLLRKWSFGENERDKDNQHRVQLALLGFDCQAANRPHSPHDQLVVCEATSGSGNIRSGCYLSMLDISLKPGITRNLKHLLPGTSLGFDYMKKEKYKSEDEREGVKVAKLNLPLS